LQKRGYMKFQYTAVDPRGKKVKGVIDAASEENAIYHIRKQDLSPVSVKPYKEKANSFWEIEIMEPEVHQLKMKKKDLMQFADKMAIMLRAGVKMSMAMDVLIASEKNRRYKKIYRAILNDLYGGASLADSMRSFKAFPDVVTNMVASGEKNGNLDWAFSRIAETYEKEIALNGKISSAFTYPIFLIVLMIALFVVMSVVVLPRFANMYDTFDAELPGITKFMMNMSNFLINYGLILLAVILLVVAVFVMLLKTNKAFAASMAQLKLQIPVYGRLVMVSNTSSFSRITSALLASGIEVVESVRVGTTVVKNAYIRHKTEKCLEQVALGATLHSALGSLGIFEPLFISMVQIGEEASMLPDTFGKMADLYEEESNEATRKFTSVLEPTLTLCIGLGIAVMVVSIILPMFNMYSAILG